MIEWKPQVENVVVVRIKCHCLSSVTLLDNNIHRLKTRPHTPRPSGDSGRMPYSAGGGALMTLIRVSTNQSSLLALDVLAATVVVIRLTCILLLEVHKNK